MGFGLQGWSVICFVVGVCVLTALAGIGLLKLKPWGRTLAIFFFSFTILNSVVNFLRPEPMIRMQRIIQDAFFPKNLVGSPGLEVLRFTQYSAGLGLALAVLQLWFVLKEKPAFVAANQSPSVSS